MKHVCVFLAFWNVDVIKTSFDSIYHEGMDFIILENHSKNSKEIFQYFKDKKIKGYIKYRENAALCAWSIFIRDHRELLLEYDYITMTEGDLYFHDIKETFREIRDGLENEDCIVSSASLYQHNHYLRTGENRIVGLKAYNRFMRFRTVEFGSHEGNTAANLITIKKENLSLLEDRVFQDIYIHLKVKELEKKWYRTSKHLVYHLTWDLYRAGNEYYEWKMSVLDTIWKTRGEFKYTYKIKL